MSEQGHLQPLAPIGHDQQVQMTDRIYSKAYLHFKISVVMSGLYSILKLCVAPIFMVISLPYKREQQIWLILITILSFFHTLYYIRVNWHCRKKTTFLRIAEQLRHSAYYTFDQLSAAQFKSRVHQQVVNFQRPQITQIQDKQVKVLALSVKYNLLKSETVINVLGKLLFLLYTALHIWGFVIYSNQQVLSQADYMILVVLVLGTYQYLQVYLGLMVVAIAIPIAVVYYIVKAIKKRKKNINYQKMLKGEIYNPMTVKGEHICHICLQEYVEHDMISTLGCNQMHHFHKSCLEEWVKVSGTCPLCRVDISVN